MTKTKLTREEKREKEQQERIAAKVAEFRADIERERAKRVYSDAVAWSEGDDKSGTALYEMVREYRSTKEQLTREITRLQEAMSEALTRMQTNDRPNWSSFLVGGRGAEVDTLVARMQALADAIARMAWGTGWYVGEVMPDRVRETRDRMLSLQVKQSAEGIWWISVDGDRFTEKMAGIRDSSVSAMYLTEQAAWVAAARIVGRYID